jgi:Zn-finger nucleic acid-binding protein
MQSPIGSHALLQPATLQEGLKAYVCPETHGHWIPAKNYWEWQSQLPAATDHHPSAHTDPTSEFEETVKVCPESGTIMTRYKVGHGADFRIDRSVTGGIWLDPGEWEALLAGNLHHELHLIFTAQWQKAIRQEQKSAAHEAMLRDRLGDELFGKAAALREELASHPARAAALAFLQS